ncbi:hypothetical protein M0R72_13850 [Candidatus Pacearchaeota archaeon]|nr:hypothetical protein [Candidatus Pacearchaeota archaeon]
MIKDNVIENFVDQSGKSFYHELAGVCSKDGLVFATDTYILCCRNISEGEPKKYPPYETMRINIKPLLELFDFSSCDEPLPVVCIRKCETCNGEIKYTGKQTCTECYGEGEIECLECGSMVECKDCKGHGEIEGVVIVCASCKNLGYTCDNAVNGIIKFGDFDISLQYYAAIQSVPDVKIKLVSKERDVNYLVFAGQHYRGVLLLSNAGREVDKSETA